MKKLRVLALMHEALVPPPSIDGLSIAEINPFKMEWDVQCALEELGHEVRVVPIADELGPIRREVQAWEPHVCFNFLTHFHEAGSYQPWVVAYLELLRVAYTGCNARGILLANDKALSKKILAYHRIPCPRFAVYRLGSRVAVPRNLDFPMIVKSVTEEASAGIAQASIVRDVDALRERVKFVHRRLGTDAIAEQYISGREMTIGVLGNRRLTTFPPFELRFENLPPGSEPIMTSRVKWDVKYQETVGVRSGPAKISDELAARIAKMAKRIYRLLGLSGFARIDLRLGDEERVWVLEANPNPDLCFGEDFAESAERAGLRYSELIQRILRLGIQARRPS